VITVFALANLFLFFDVFRTPVVNPSLRATYQKFGVTIQYPVGAQVHTSTSPNSTFGAIFWLWNDDNTELGIEWTNESSQPIYSVNPEILGPPMPNATILQTGNSTINGRIWRYVTYDFTYQRRLYLTEAVFYNQTEQRFYMISYYDQSNNTLSELDNWGATFNG